MTKRGPHTKVTPYLRSRALRLYGSKCFACGSQENLTVDHKVPVAHGGTNDLTNLQILCYDCNQRKGSRNCLHLA